MSDQEKSTGNEGDQPAAAPATESPATPTTGKVAKKKAARKKVAKKKAAKKTATRKKATTKKTATSKKVAKKKTSKKKAAKKVTAHAASAREAEKQAVSNAIRAAASVGGDLMKSGSEQKRAPTAPQMPQAAAESARPGEHTGSGTEAESRPRQEAREHSPAEEAAARAVEKKAVSDAILAAAKAGGSLVQPHAAGHTMSTQPADAPTPSQEPPQPPAQPEPGPVAAATPLQAAAPARRAGHVDTGIPPTPQGRTKGPGIAMRILLVALGLAAAGLYAKILMPDFHVAGLMPEFTEETTTAGQGPAGLRELPESQMQIIREVFAPELGQD